MINPNIESWLHKSGAWLGVFSEKKRYFVLDTQQKQIRWYTTAAKTEPRGVIDLLSATSGPTGEAGFELSTQHRHYDFRADTPEVATKWIDALAHLLSATGSERIGGDVSGQDELAPTDEVEVRLRFENSTTRPA